MTKGVSKPLLILATGFAAMAGVGGYAWYESRRPPVLEVYVFDTPGQPSIFMRTPDDRRILIGGGANADIVRRLTGILPFYSRRIDMIIAPDTDARNVTGLIEIMNRYDVGKVLALASSSDPIYRVFQETIRNRAIPMEEFSAGMRLEFGKVVGKVAGTILFPVSATDFAYSKASPSMLCMRISYGSASILLMGNAGMKTQKFIAAEASTSPNIFPVSVLITSNSISSGNIADKLLKVARPEYLVYSQTVKAASKKSTAKNAPAIKKSDPLAGMPYDHRFNVREKGAVKITSDGASVEVI